MNPGENLITNPGQIWKDIPSMPTMNFPFQPGSDIQQVWQEFNNYANELNNYTNELMNRFFKDYSQFSEYETMGRAQAQTKMTVITATEGIDINISEAWSKASENRDVVVALIDTGVDYTHEDLQNKIWTNVNEIAGNGIDDDGNGYIDDVYGWNFYDNNNQIYSGSDENHGTHGAGTIL